MSDDYTQSITQPEIYWAEQAQRYIHWDQPWQSVLRGNMADGDVQWFVGAKLNACANCVDRHLPRHANKTAIIWEPDAPTDAPITLSYQQLYEAVCRYANVLLQQGVKKGDRVCVYMPMTPEAAIAMLACARIGAVHTVVFGGFSAQALADRIRDTQAICVITADVALRGGKAIALKDNVDAALSQVDCVQHVLVHRYTDTAINWLAPRDVDYTECAQQVAADCPYVLMDAEDPLFILYTSGSTGKPKGVVHTTGGYMVYAAFTHQRVFDVQDNDIFWCTADVGWITGHTYLVYGPLANATTVLMFAGVPTYPDISRFWQVVDRHQVSILYTAPTAIRLLMGAGDAPVKQHSRASLRVLGSVGEPINPDVWQWYHDVVGDGRCPVVDTWWQTEMGGIAISATALEARQKPGAATKPLPGIVPCILDEKDQPVGPNTNGRLVITAPWPGMMRSLYNNHPRYLQSYFATPPGVYFTGDGAMCDAEGDFWISGRIDDVINISGHRIGTAEVESALVEAEEVSEAAVVGVAHAIKGETLYAFVTLMQGEMGSEALATKLNTLLRQHIGPIAKLDYIQWAADLPKTRSGKIMRRILRLIAEGRTEGFGDTSTLADPGVVDTLLAERIDTRG